ncbi:hypothetical protein CFBP6600_13370 [Xanthomonas arboricola pv. corylina]|uniref:hypothetical protein n=1 Tax=Xanthomonas arboricola TaxID=56448 RepID=UPI0011B05897|nr:hypothetical protein [Xanthomonas arboricola]CAE6737366.1 hypothetical protein CFBP6600_13370 [Xanthomonas arboricola pv. corylina]CAE6737385.1 hypothetical protein CFBP6600_13370 [Xanthomonas arboricola pv. corylina]
MSFTSEIIPPLLRYMKEKGLPFLVTLVAVGTISGIAFALLGPIKAVSFAEKGMAVGLLGIFVSRLSEAYMAYRSKFVRVIFMKRISSYLRKQSTASLIERSEVRKAALAIAYVDHLRVKTLKVRGLLLASFAVFFCIWLLAPQYETLSLALTCLIAHLVITFYLMTLGFRVKNGYFGRSEGEARKFIKYIQENAESIDFNNGDGSGRRIFEQIVSSSTHKIPVSNGVASR